MAVTLKVEKIIRETDDAILVQLLEDEREVWLPFSQVARIVRAPADGTGPVLVVTDWIAEKEDL